MAKKKNKTPAYPLFGNGVLTKDNDPSYVMPISSVQSYADDSGPNLSVLMPGYSPINYPLQNISTDPTTGRISFVSANTPYGIREIGEDDGQWLSKYQTPLPQEAIEALLSPDSLGDTDPMGVPADNFDMPDERLDAYAFDDSPYVVGLLYTNSAGQFMRNDGVWTLLAPDDTTFSSEDLTIIPINPKLADQFVQFYDQNYVTVQDAERYEDPAEALQNSTPSLIPDTPFEPPVAQPYVSSPAADATVPQPGPTTPLNAQDSPAAATAPKPQPGPAVPPPAPAPAPAPTTAPTAN